MTPLTDTQIDYIVADLYAHGIRLEGLRDNLLDHICILVEEKLDAGGDFEEVYAAVIPTFYRTSLYELEEEALFLASLHGPHLVLSRGRFFVLAFAFVLGPWLAYMTQWFFFERPVINIPYALDAIGWAVVLDVYPLLTVIILFLTPNRFDPLIPWGSKILLGLKPLIRVLPAPVA
jgi:hypothetical protein